MWKVFLIVMALYSFCLSLLLDSPLSCHAVACRHRLHFLLFSFQSYFSLILPFKLVKKSLGKKETRHLNGKLRLSSVIIIITTTIIMLNFIVSPVSVHCCLDVKYEEQKKIEEKRQAWIRPRLHILESGGYHSNNFIIQSWGFW